MDWALLIQYTLAARLSVGEGELLEADGKLHVARPHDVLDLELRELGLLSPPLTPTCLASFPYYAITMQCKLGGHLPSLPEPVCYDTVFSLHVPGISFENRICGMTRGEGEGDTPQNRSSE